MWRVNFEVVAGPNSADVAIVNNQTSSLNPADSELQLISIKTVTSQSANAIRRIVWTNHSV